MATVIHQERVLPVGLKAQVWLLLWIDSTGWEIGLDLTKASPGPSHVSPARIQGAVLTEHRASRAVSVPNLRSSVNKVKCQ